MAPQILSLGQYDFGWLSLSCLIVGLAMACLGLFVLVRERASLIGRSFLFLCLCVCLYLTAAALNYGYRSDVEALFWGRIANVGVVFIPTSILLLAAAKFGLIRKYRFFISSGFILSAFFAAAALFSDQYLRAVVRFPWGYFGQFGLIGYVFSGYFLVIMVFSLQIYWAEYRHATSELRKKRFRGLLIGFLGGYIGAIDFLPAFGIPILPIGFIPISFFIAMSAYVVVRYRLDDITPALAASQILETMQGAVIVTDLDGRIRLINRTALELLGHESSELMGRNLTDILALPADILASIRSGGSAANREMTWKTRSRQVDVSVSVSPLTAPRSRYQIGTVYVAADITDLNRSTSALRRNEERLRLALEATKQGWFDLNVTTGDIMVSPEYARILGHDPSDFHPTMQMWFESVHDDERDMLINKHHECLSSGRQCSMEYRTRTRSGEWKWIRSTGQVVEYDPIGKPARVMGTHADITERRQTEEALAQSEHFNRSILEGVDEGFIVVDREYRILAANKAYINRLGRPIDDIVGSNCFSVSHNQERPCYETGEDCAVHKVFETGEPATAYHLHHDADGNSQHIEIKAFPLRKESGMVTSVIESISDVTAKHQLDEERLKAQKLEAVGTLAGGIAHDFNNLLQGVFGYISLATLSVDSKEKTLQMLLQAQTGLHLAVKLTTQLLTFSKGGKPAIRPIDIGRTVEDAAKFALSGSRSEYRLVADEGLWAVKADDGQISQVVQNIVLNADQAMPEGGLVTIDMRNISVPGTEAPRHLPEGRYVKITIADSGVGIPEKHLGKIFDPYFTTKQKGSGLGLATSHSIITNHKGHISVRSRVNEGTTFCIYLPAAESAPVTSHAQLTAAPAQCRRSRILVMDDEPSICDVVCEMLSVLGHDASFAVHGEDAIEQYQTAMLSGNPFDMIILDLTIKGGMGGVEALQRIRRIDPAVKAAVSSGYSDSAAVANYAKHGFQAFLNKPYCIDSLRDLLNTLLVSSSAPATTLSP